MDKEEPPSPERSARSPMFRIGRDSRGNWVVQDQCGLRGGMFVGRAEALRFALFENGNHPQAVIMVPGVLELDVRRKSSPDREPDMADAFSERQVA